MVKWIDEKVLQYYFKDNFKKYPFKFGDKENPIDGCDFNHPFDKFPDIVGELNGKEVLIEVEWLSSKYDHDKRTPDEHRDFLNKGGKVVVFEKDAEISGNPQQVIIQHDDFKKWFVKNSNKIFDESVKAFKEESLPSRQYKKIWLIYIGRDVEKNLQIGKENNVWGFTEKRFKMRNPPIIKQIKKNDIVVFLGPTIEKKSGKYHSGRDFPREKYYGEVKKSNFLITNFEVFKITQDYWNEEILSQDESRDYNPIWVDETKENKKYPHRFHFTNSPIVKFSNVDMKKISKSTIETLRKLMIGDSPQELDSVDFIELISNVTV